MTYSYLVKILLIISCVVILNSCVTTPTGRNQLILFSNAQLAESGKQAFTAMKAEQTVAKTAEVNRYVQCITNAITAKVVNRQPTSDWELAIFEADQVNAFALPGGKIGVYTGLLGVAKNQHQLATVIGHEVAHVIAQHGNERMSQSALIGLGQQAVSNILIANEVSNTPTIMQALGLGVQLGVALPYSRTHESEADIIGLELMASAGFDPRESIQLWRNMNAANDGRRPPEFMSTHPAPDTRINNLSAHMPKAMALYQANNNKPACG